MIRMSRVTFGGIFSEIHPLLCLWYTLKKVCKNDSFSMTYSPASEKISHKSLQCAKNQVHVLEDA